MSRRQILKASKSIKVTVIIGMLCSPMASAQKNILLIGTDGTSARYINGGINQIKPYSSIPQDSAEPRPLPTFQSIMNEKQGAITLNITSTLGSNGKYNTISGANWTSLLTGKEYDVHGVMDNTVVSLSNDSEALQIFKGYNGTKLLTSKLADMGYKTKLMAEWQPLKSVYGRFFDEAENVPLVWYDTNPDGSRGEHTKVNSENYKVGVELSETDANFVFVHIDSVDDDGHSYGWDTSQYAKGVRQLDDKVNEILKGLMARENINNEEWVIGITPDHGGVSNDHSDGGNPLIYDTYFIALHWNKGVWSKVTLKVDPDETIADVLPRLMATRFKVDGDLSISVDSGRVLDNISPLINKDSWVNTVDSEHTLSKVGDGTLILKDDTNFAQFIQAGGVTVLSAEHEFDAVNINAGSLVVESSLNTSELKNKSILINNGKVTGDITLYGGSRTSGDGLFNGNMNILPGAVVAPGNSVGDWSVDGDITFSKNSVYELEVAADHRSDSILSSGKATIDGGEVAVTLENSANLLTQGEVRSLLGQQYTILTAQQGVSGQFDAVAPNYLFLGTGLSYQPTGVTLSVGRNGTSFASVAQTPNERAVAAAADALAAGNPVYESVLNSGTAGEARQAFRQLSGQIHADIASALVNDSRYLREALNGRLRQAEGLASSSAIKADEGGAWAQLLGAWDHASGDANATGYQASTYGVLVGLDSAVAGDGRLGVATGYTRTSLHGGYGSKADSDNYHLAAYGDKQFGALALRGGAGYTWHRIDTKRSVNYGMQSDRDMAKYSARTEQLFAEAGYSVQGEWVNLEPFVNLAYVNFENNGIAESGGAAALRGDKQHTDATVSTLGLRADTAWQVSPGTTVALRSELGWQHQYGDLDRGIGLRFNGGKAPFVVDSVPVSRDGMMLKAGAEVAVNENATLSLGYGGLLSQHHQDNSVNAGFTWHF
ncbi:hypothetical protein DM934_21135 [Salmonella enterica]|nr:autotransporter outer membrane beta-barrel domain-containing protein [Salmonella enterica]EAY4537627.1 autotransporter outer membrane beta-barrel domain-containing protein [Salmonella enterica]EAY4559742.1 autotransporter outer membrane beta-barrel domain-containing protein [Salmonella enterica]EBA0652844.1 autotransporter outer membrane beta-barrel domain-containing protein [Salmonella enterica]EBB5268754.1 autotransporter outer membrane beta-barrel domain-containing protein [Salmonella ent